MRRLHIVMPMGGLGSRFNSENGALPKPLLQIHGEPFFKKALSSLQRLTANATITLVVRAPKEEQNKLENLFKAEVPNINIIFIEALTRGAVETSYLARSYMQPNDAVVLLDCDLWFECSNFLTYIEESLLTENPNAAGALIYFNSNKPIYSYLETKDGYVSKTAEKIAISDKAILGAYYFTKAEYFISAADWVLSRPVPSTHVNEYYSSFLYNRLIEQKMHILAFRCDDFLSFGTPEELAAIKK